MASPRRSLTRRKAKAAGFRSGLEQRIADQLDERGAKYEYESVNISYEAVHRYTPDFVLPNGVILEIKGRFTGKDRTKHLQIKKAHPDLDIRFVFQRNNTLGPKSSTRYSEWCEKHGFQYCFIEIPAEWLAGGDDGNV